LTAGAGTPDRRRGYVPAVVPKRTTTRSLSEGKESVCSYGDCRSRPAAGEPGKFFFLGCAENHPTPWKKVGMEKNGGDGKIMLDRHFASS
jgi:hypothetical protein